MEAKSEIIRDLTRRIGNIRLDALPDVLKALERASRETSAASRAEDGLVTLAEQILELPMEGSRLDAIQRAIIAHALLTCKGNISAVARLLGTERKHIERKIAKYRLKEPRPAPAPPPPPPARRGGRRSGAGKTS